MNKEKIKDLLAFSILGLTILALIGVFVWLFIIDFNNTSKVFLVLFIIFLVTWSAIRVDK